MIPQAACAFHSVVDSRAFHLDPLAVTGCLLSFGRCAETLVEPDAFRVELSSNRTADGRGGSSQLWPSVTRRWHTIVLGVGRILGPKVGFIERSIRRGQGNPELAGAIRRDEEGSLNE